MSAPLAGSWALVTGASSGIGAALARGLAHRGAHLVLTARSKDRLTDLAVDLRRVNGIQAHVIAVDLARPDGPSQLLARTLELGRSIDHLVNNAGFGSSGRLAELDAAREDDMVHLNVGAVVTLTRALLPSMIARGSGGVLNVASTAAFQPVPFMATYAASKAFVLSFTQALTAELSGTGVHAMALCPGPVPTGFQSAAGFTRAGLSLAVLSAERTAESALDAYARRESVYVPGIVNTAQSIVSRLAPDRLVAWVTVRAMRRWGRV
jgi:short-subunit dehydrogenase